MQQEILDLTKKMLAARDEYKKAKEISTNLEKEKKKLELELCSKMDDLEIQAYKHEEYGTIFRSNRVWCKIVDQEKADIFLRQHGVYDDVMQLEVKLGRLNALVKKVYLDKTGVVPESEIGVSVVMSPIIGNRNSKTGGDIGEAPETPGL